MNKVSLKKVSFYSNKGSHIERNTNGAWSYQKAREASHWTSAVNSRVKQHHAKKRIGEMEEEKRNEILGKMGKWEQFRVDRQETVNRYCKLRKNQQRAKLWIIVYFRQCVQTRIKMNMKARLQARLKRQDMIWQVSFVIMRFKIALKKCVGSATAD